MEEIQGETLNYNDVDSSLETIIEKLRELIRKFNALALGFQELAHRSASVFAALQEVGKAAKGSQ